MANLPWILANNFIKNERRHGYAHFLKFVAKIRGNFATDFSHEFHKKMNVGMYMGIL